MQLDGSKRAQFREALLDAFTPFTFPQMMTERLGRDFFRYAPPSLSFDSQLFYVIDSANRENWIGELITGAREFNPGNVKLFAFAEIVGLNPIPKQE